MWEKYRHVLYQNVLHMNSRLIPSGALVPLKIHEQSSPPVVLRHFHLPDSLRGCSLSFLSLSPESHRLLPQILPTVQESDSVKATAPFSWCSFLYECCVMNRGREQEEAHEPCLMVSEGVSPHGRDGCWSSLVHSSWVVCQGLDMPWQTGCRDLQRNWRLSVTFKGLYLVTYFCQIGSVF